LGIAERTVATPSLSEFTVSATPNGGRLFISSHRVARSTSLRASRTSRILASSSTWPASCPSCRQNAGMSNTSRATSQARVMSGTGRPVSSSNRNRNVLPPVSTISLTSEVVMISRRSRCALIRSANLARSGAGK
jgi:hypothetical protein